MSGTGSRRSSQSLRGRGRLSRAPRCGRSCGRRGSRGCPGRPSHRRPGQSQGGLPRRRCACSGEGEWPETGRLETQHAGLFLLIGDLIALDLPGLVDAAGWPSTSQLDALHSVLALMALKLSGRRRRSHVAERRS